MNGGGGQEKIEKRFRRELESNRRIHSGQPFDDNNKHQQQQQQLPLRSKLHKQKKKKKKSSAQTEKKKRNLIQEGSGEAQLTGKGTTAAASIVDGRERRSKLAS